MLRGPICPKFPQNGRLLVPVVRKLRSMAKIARLCENTKVTLYNIAIFWWDYLVLSNCRIHMYNKLTQPLYFSIYTSV